MSDLPPKSPKWGILREGPGILTPPASEGWGVKEKGEFKRGTGYLKVPRFLRLGGVKSMANVEFDNFFKFFAKFMQQYHNYEKR
jgi:hypothetical protein